MYIDLEHYIKPHIRVLSGREEGAAIRRELNLDTHDNTDETVYIEIPSYIYSLNSSYFLSCFGNSVRKLGREAFSKKYIFKCDLVIRKNIEDGISRAYKTSDVLEHHLV